MHCRKEYLETKKKFPEMLLDKVDKQGNATSARYRAQRTNEHILRLFGGVWFLFLVDGLLRAFSVW